jgi:hypothetical protein
MTAKKVLDPQTVPEVQRVLEEIELMDDFKARHRAFLEEFRERARSYNSAVEAADKVLRAELASCGPFDLFQIDTSYDAERLYSEVGEEEFKQLGGTVHPVPEYKIEKETIEALIKMGRIPPEIVKVVQKKTPKYHKPKTFVIP